MTAHVPSTELVRLSYALTVPPKTPGTINRERERAFDRWLEERDRRIAMRAYEEGKRAIADNLSRFDRLKEELRRNPYREGSPC